MPTYKGVEINTTPTDGMVEEAVRGLEWRKKHGRGGTEVGVARARDISNRKELSIDTVKRMYSFFSRHEVDKQAEGFDSGEDGYPSAGRIAWALWGGDPGFSFARRVRESIESADNKDNDRAALSGSVKKGLTKKAEDHNEDVGDVASKRTNVRTLSAVFRRGVGAYKTNPGSVRPTVTSPEQWAYARVNSFLYVLRNGKFRSGKHDTDLLPKGHPLSSDDRSIDSEGDNKWSDKMDNIVENQEVIEDSSSLSLEEVRDDIDSITRSTQELVAELSEKVEAVLEEFNEVVEGEELEDVLESDDLTELDDEERHLTTSHTRAMEMDMSPINEDKRTVRMAISSEEPVMRSFGMEVLEHSEEAMDLSFLQSGRAPLLLDHDPEKQVGIIESVSLDSSARRLRATVRFGKGALAREAFDDVNDGIKANVSIGYSVNKMERKGKDTYVVKSFRIHEASLVSIPADVTVGVGRSSEASQQPIIITDNKDNTMSEVDISAVEAQARQAAQKNAAQIIELGSRHDQSDMAQRAISQGNSIEEFRGELLEKIGSKRALEDTEIGMTDKEVKRFSFLRAIHALANPTDRRAQEAASFEFEASRAAAEQYGTTAQGIMIPSDVMRNWKRDMSAGSDGGLIGEDFRGEDFIDALRNASSVMQAGARMLTGLSGDVKIPKKTAGSAAAFVSAEGVAVGESEMTIGNVALAPKTLGAFTDVTRQLLIQSSLDVEALIRDDLATAIAIAIDKAGLEGSGTGGNPTGILNQTGVNTVTAFAGANPTFAEVVTLETAVAEDNALMGNLSYILPASMYGALKTTEKATNTAQFVVEPGGTMNGYRGIVSNQATAGNLYFGNFSDLLIGMFGGLDLVVDPYSLSTTGTVRVVALQSVDVAVRHAQSFAFGNDG